MTGRDRVARSLDFRSVPNPVVNPAKQPNEIPTLGQINEAIAAHKAEANSHYQYVLKNALGTEVAATTNNAIQSHKTEPDPHSQYVLKSALGTASARATGDFEVPGTASSAIAAHKAEANPHSQYALKVSLGTASTKAITDFEGAGAVRDAIAAHEVSTNHPLVTATAAGLMGAADKVKLDGLSLPTDFLTKSGNFADVSDKASARTNLGLGSAAQASSNSFEAAGAVSTHAAKYGKGFHVPVAGITDAELAVAAAIADSKLSFTIPTWTNVTHALGWGNHTGSEALAYRKFSTNLVQLSGVAAKTSALITNDLICTLPAGYRPDRTARFVIYGASSGGTLVSVFLTINTSGEMRLQFGNTNPTQYVAIPNNCIFFAT